MEYDDDAAFALTLQMAIIKEARINEFGKLTADHDAAIALSLFEEDISTRLRLANDSRMARSITNAVQNDTDVLDLMASVNRQVERDRQLALSSANMPDPCPPSNSAAGSSRKPSWVTRDWHAIYGHIECFKFKASTIPNGRTRAQSRMYKLYEYSRLQNSIM